MGKYKIESYNSRMRLEVEKTLKEAEDLRMKKIEFDSYKESIIKEYIEQQKKQTSLTKRFLGVFKKSK